MSVTSLRPARDAQEWALRVDLAAAFRLAVLNDWHEAVANHFSVATDAGGSRFLMNPRWMHFSRVRASDLLHLDAQDAAVMEGQDAPDPSAWCIHGRIHALVPEARCVLHAHPPYATALAALADPTLLPVDQNTARFFRRVAVDLAYGGIADQEAEGVRLAGMLGRSRRLMMGNHGVLVAAPTVGQAFDDLYYLERACRTLMLAYAAGRPLSILSDEVAEATARSWDSYAEAGEAHFSEAKRLLDARGENYAD
jgi:ribulose-5-phosphate 4-epimerase/fuculose-1-phosphate aldolase